MKWVFPEEELPVPNKRILVATKGGRVVACGARLMNGWVIDEEYKNLSDKEIYAWAPIASVPRREKKPPSQNDL